MAIILKKKGATATIENRTGVVGTRSTCDLVVVDPMVAERHCAFTEEDGGWFVEDLGTSSGTYVDGLAAEGRTKLEGDGKINIVIGVSKFVCQVDAEKGVLTCNLKEQSFFYDKKEDPLRWSRYEVEFGRFRPVRIGNYVALLLVGLLFFASFIDAVEEPLVEPGPLADVHRAEHLAIHASQGLEQLAAAGHENGACAACHAGWTGTPSSSCGVCHQSIVHEPTHPPSWQAESCQPCHVDHRGRDRASLTSIRAEDSCVQCHGARVPDVTAPVPPRDDTPWVALAYDAFPHDKHLSVAATEDAPEGMRIKDCESCHEYADVPQPADPTRGIPEREFKRIKYERCQECHGSASAPDPVNWTTAWHGADDDGGTQCAQCHQDLHAPELTQVKRLSRATFSSGAHLYALTLRDHHDQFETGGKDCADCHRDGKISATSMKDRPFLHGVHLSKDPDKSQGQCRECHTDVVSGSLARSLTAGVYTHPLDDKNCFECHDTGIPQAGLRSGIPQLASTNQFPHASHLDTSKPGLENGCLSCHTLTSDLRSPDVPGTRPEARSCTECHQNHENVGGGDCRACHRTGDPVYRGESIMKSWPQPNAFSHRSRGHRDATCAECHTGTEGASSLREVPIPSEAETSCRDCHVKKRARFHWK